MLASWAADETASPDFRAPGLVAAAVNADPQRLIAADAGAPDGKNLLRVRMRTVARGEFYGVDNDFPERLLALDFPGMLSHDQSNRDLVLEEAMRGGYPDGRFGTDGSGRPTSATTSFTISCAESAARTCSS